MATTVKFKQIFLAQFSQKFLFPISNYDSSPVHLNRLNDLEEIVLLVCITSLSVGSFCQLFTASDFENIGVFAGGTDKWLQLQSSNDLVTD